ncbi:peptidase M50 [Gemmatirosa kalamazoonensis]|uniref:Peptidase M50 n=1 Tax=Gemmatirosa kalamazoonensis TaxID=861299 RepID=W0RMP0_9BACT|nr:site-2 protease family protein [Gemmatirosa kalamazoonensis]AHG90683.1 peptidase M50 [Gemmatirosa kalamazoonensis]
MNLTDLLIVAPVLLFSMVAHEYAHGYAALRQGDPTAYQLGRLTFNPVKHIDPFMTIILPVMTALTGGFIFGGAKPVPVDPRNYRSYRRGDIIVSLAGIATNLVLAAVCAALIVPLGMLGRALPAATTSLAILQEMMRAGVMFNLILAFFNLLPIPPLDGSHVAKYLLPPAWGLRYAQLGRFGFLIVLLFLTVGRGVLAIWMAPAGALNAVATTLVSPYLLPNPL